LVFGTDGDAAGVVVGDGVGVAAGDGARSPLLQNTIG